ncbi:LysR family transcriptional regulator [Providencia huaxiensis]|uniref:LysR family transcriptional regulator n=1 Tax=Providencia huaxiensis TaxID=2027290 RepID=A0A345M2B5_9GAMM|nr:MULTISPECIES: LysR family transcriptional regulator [Providencia]MBZ3681709.1 LysR family transcriptional regulator [Providencia rettgeri]AXH64505.1 LysR family transcriptional regulator [Providencia huaxiensis]MBN6359997.1 LysR family transcriptional regulator [Providencia huaxiensis]MBQ0269020.1 LysR family transcriptional regulator [Providencia huaxiensis]MBQ0536117.1 LysR family transcriptional regulator [Providencia huaxiensis]
MPFNSDNLTVFLTVLDKGSFSAAARALKRVPSAVSMAVANLEAELGFELFDRHTREPKPTEKALSLAPYARHIIANLSQLNTFSLELSQGVESTLTIGIAAGINANLLFDALHILSQRYPLLHIELITAPQDDLLPLLHEQQIHLAIVFGGLNVNSQEQFHYIGEESIIATISAKHPSLQNKTSLYIEDLVESRQIIIASRQRELSDIRILVSSNYWKADSFSLALGLVENGMGWGNFPLSLIKDKLNDGSLKPLEFKNTPNGFKLPIHAVCLKGHVLKRGAQECIELLKKVTLPSTHS